MRVHLASGDLQSRARIGSAAERLGLELTTGAAVGFGDHLDGVGVLVLDLDAGRDAALTELAHAATSGEVPARVLGFYSHVDEELRAAAEAAGVEAITRGEFWRNLEEILPAAT